MNNGVVYGMNGVIPIGYVGENDAREIEIDIRQLLRAWPELTPVLLAKRPGENTVYPCVTRVENGVLFWKVTSSDTAIPGKGECVIHMIDGDGRVGKSRTMTTMIEQSTSGEETQEPPEAARPWVNEVIEAAKDAKDAAKRAEEIAGALSGSGGSIDSGLFLPPVNEEDNGKVLTVVGGKWEAEKPKESGVQFKTDDTLTLEDGILAVNTADKVEEDNTLPVTSAAVYTEVGNINALLATI